MRTVEGRDASVVEKTLRTFIAGLSQCRFAPHYMGGKQAATTVVFAGQLDDGDVASLNDLIVAAAAEESVAILVFPEVRNADGVVRLLHALAADDRWAITLPPRGKHPHDDTLVGVWWTTPDGRITSVMGLAPIGEMPVTRRAPHVALVVWGGPHLNEHRTASATEVGLTSMRPPDAFVDAARYSQEWDKTRENVRAAMAFPVDAAARPHVAFSLSATVRTALEPVASSCDARGRPVH